jgi:ribosomal protein S18 acetylase RimI-like enzyme
MRQTFSPGRILLSMSVIIRPLTPGDVEQVVAFSLEAWAVVHESFEQVLGQKIFRRVYPDWRAMQAADVREACLGGKADVWVAEVGGHPVGFVAVVVDEKNGTGEIDMVAVDPAHQRQGIGLTLTNVAIDHLRSSGCTLAVVATGGDPGHTPARRTYEAAGFTGLPLVRYYQTL